MKHVDPSLHKRRFSSVGQLIDKVGWPLWVPQDTAEINIFRNSMNFGGMSSRFGEHPHYLLYYLEWEQVVAALTWKHVEIRMSLIDLCSCLSS